MKNFIFGLSYVFGDTQLKTIGGGKFCKKSNEYSVHNLVYIYDLKTDQWFII